MDISVIYPPVKRHDGCLQILVNMNQGINYKHLHIGFSVNRVFDSLDIHWSADSYDRCMFFKAALTLCVPTVSMMTVLVILPSQKHSVWSFICYLPI